MEYVIDWKSDACRGGRPAPSRRHVCPLLPNEFPRVYASLHEPVSSTAASVSLLNEKSVEAQCPAMAHFTQRNSSGSYHGSPGPPRPAAAPVPVSPALSQLNASLLIQLPNVESESSFILSSSSGHV